MSENIKKFTESDIYAIGWEPYTIAYLLQLINGEWTNEQAREDISSLVGSKYDSRTAKTMLSTIKDEDAYTRI